MERDFSYTHPIISLANQSYLEGYPGLDEPDNYHLDVKEGHIVFISMSGDKVAKIEKSSIKLIEVYDRSEVKTNVVAAILLFTMRFLPIASIFAKLVDIERVENRCELVITWQNRSSWHTAVFEYTDNEPMRTAQRAKRYLLDLLKKSEMS